MGRDKRKTRLDKGGTSGGEFVGFSACAAPSAVSLKASPVYTGSDAQLSLVLKRITQKRDAVTKAKALGARIFSVPKHNFVYTRRHPIAFSGQSGNQVNA